MIDMMDVESSMFGELGYDYERNVLAVRYTNGSLYLYHEVAEWLWNELQAADSMGQFFSAEIRDSHRFERVDET